jgi:hypothetical protein
LLSLEFRLHLPLYYSFLKLSFPRKKRIDLCLSIEK